MVGLGRMGTNMVRRLMRGGHRCLVFDFNQTNVENLTKVRSDRRTFPRRHGPGTVKAGERWTLSAGQLIDIGKWNLLRHIPVKMRGGRR